MHDDEILDRLPASGDAQSRELRRLRQQLSADPSNLGRAVKLARRYVSAGRSAADPRYYGYAEAALKPWWDRADPPPDVLVLRAVLHQSRHDFDAALADLERVLARRPGHGQARLTRAFVLQVLGRHDEARESCHRLPASTPALVRTACSTRIDALSGRARDGYDRLAGQLQTSRGAAAGVRLWARTILAETAAQLGRDEAAERHFEAARALDRRDVYMLGAYADFLLDRGRTEEARRLLDGDTRPDALLLRLALAKHRLGDAGAEADIAALRDRFEASRRRGDTRHGREETRFALHLLNQPERALRLGLENWAKQREPWDARLVLEAALAARAPEAARPVLDWIERAGLEDIAIRRLAGRLEKGAL